MPNSIRAGPNLQPYIELSYRTNSSLKICKPADETETIYRNSYVSFICQDAQENLGLTGSGSGRKPCKWRASVSF
jgi:hypothetical protein